MSVDTSSSILVRLMEFGEFSDLKFLCNGEEFKVHKAVICTQSPVIKAAIQGGFEEFHTNVIKMDNFDPKVVRRLVQFMYTGDYDVAEDQRGAASQNTSEAVSDAAEGGAISGSQPQPQPQPDADEKSTTCSTPPSPPKLSATDFLFEHIRVNSIGDYYGIKALVSHANSKIKHLLRKGAEDQSWVGDLPVAIETALQSTGDHEVQRLLAEATATNLGTLLASDRLKSLSVLGDFAIKVLQSCAKEIDSLHEKFKAIALLQQLVERRERQQEQQNKSLKECLSVLNRTNQCRNCFADFTCSIDPNEYVLRCKKCLCKHG